MCNSNNVDKPLNLSYLEKISGTNTKFIVTTIDLFNSRMPQLMEEIGDAIASRNWDKIAFLVHKMKTSFSYLGREDIIEDLIEIEQLSLNKVGQANIVLCFEHVKAAINKLREQLTLYKSQLAN
ncbi:Hpt domain-containing protein [Pedobacter terrae]|uniref:Hpt domain-containing protein n=1 Tax=Pedobacter terrae TaxID=405671 RepID=UPI002FF47609